MAINSEKPRSAIEWLVCLRQEQAPSQSTIEEWEEWIAHPEHQAAFDTVVTLWERSGAVGQLTVPEASELAADDYDGSESIGDWLVRHSSQVPESAEKDAPISVASVPVGSAPAKRPRPWYRRTAFATAAGIALLAWFAYVQIWSTITGGPQLHETSVGEHRVIALNDGSEVLLGAQSSLRVAYKRNQRIIVLERGEALFNVARDTRRPFSVYAGRGSITAVGTSFSVRRNRKHVRVTVAEGVVRVEQHALNTQGDGSEVPASDARPLMLTKGLQANYDERGGGVSVTRVDVRLATAWREGRLLYVDETLADVVSDVNRYSERKVVLDGREAEGLRFTGVVFKEHAGKWVDQITDVFPMLEIVETNTERIVLRVPDTDRLGKKSR